MPLRIAAIAYTDYESAPRVRREAEALSERGDAVTVWASRGPGRPREEMVNGVRVVRLGGPRYRGDNGAAYLASYLRFMAEVQASLTAAHLLRRFDIIHVHTVPDFMVFVAAVSRLAGARVVLDMHDLMPSLFGVKFGFAPDSAGTAVLRRIERAATLFADLVIAAHENQYNLLLERGVPARKLAVVMNAADPVLFSPRKKEPRVREDGPIRLVCHGSLLRRRGVEQALEAFKRARAQEPRIRLQIIGGGDDLPRLKARASRLELGAPEFEMDGRHRNLEEVAEAIRGAHLGLVPGRELHEDSALPTNLLEYLAVGIPTITSRTRTVDRSLTNEQTQLVAPDDVAAMAHAIVELVRDGSRRRALTKAGWAWTERFGWNVNRALLFRAFDHLCFEKAQAERRARQARIEGKKTGPRGDQTRAVPG